MPIALGLSGCTLKEHISYKELSKEDGPQQRYTGYYKVGKPYEVKNVSYTPKKPEEGYVEIGTASWYGQESAGVTANGQKYNSDTLIAAHKSLPIPSMVKVTDLATNKQLIVMIADRGPFAKGRVLDLSEKAATILGFKKRGVTKVRLEYLPKETEKLLAKLSLPKVHGARASGDIKDSKCSVNCYVKLLNKEHNINIASKE